jgi:hypothetical protein
LREDALAAPAIIDSQIAAVDPSELRKGLAQRRNALLTLRIRPSLSHGNTKATHTSFNHLVGAQQEGLGNGETDRLGSLEVYDQLESCRLLHR